MTVWRRVPALHSLTACADPEFLTLDNVRNLRNYEMAQGEAADVAEFGQVCRDIQRGSELLFSQLIVTVPDSVIEQQRQKQEKRMKDIEEQVDITSIESKEHKQLGSLLGERSN